jgi:hypothetical protein
VPRRRHRPTIAVPWPVAEVDVVFELDEIRKHVVPAPPRYAKRSPTVVVDRPAAEREPRQPRRAADDPLAPNRFRRLPRRDVAPVERLTLDRPTITQRRRHVRAAIGPGLEQQHRPRPRLRQPGRHHASSRSTTNHHYVDSCHRSTPHEDTDAVPARERPYPAPRSRSNGLSPSSARWRSALSADAAEHGAACYSWATRTPVLPPSEHNGKADPCHVTPPLARASNWIL